MQDTAGALAECAALEVELAELRAAYEQYFSGIERVAPLKRHEALKKRFKKLKTSFIRQTATKFRINSLHSKYLTYERQWEKIIQQREDGTYRPDLERARRRAQRLQGAAAQREGRKEGPGRQAVELDLEEDVSLDDFDFSEFDAPKAPAAAPAVEDEFDALLSSLTEAPTPDPPPRTVSPPSTAPGSRPSSGAHAAAPSAPERAAAPVTRAPVGTVTGARPSSGAGPAVPRPGASGTVAPATTRPVSGSLPAVGAVARPAAPARPVTSAGTSSAPRPVSTSAGTVSDEKLRAVYDAYVNAKRRCNEDVSKLSFERVSSELRQEVGAVTQRSGAKSVEFKVVIKDGRAELRTLPKD